MSTPEAYYGYDETVLERMDELGCAGDGCGCLVKFHLTIEDDLIIRARWWAREIGGPGAAHDAAARFAQLVEGKNILDAARIGHADIAVNESDDTYSLVMVAEDALHHALGAQVIAAARAGVHAPLRDDSILVAMSGGVDSAVCLHRSIARADGDVAGCTLRLWIDPKGPDPDRACCAPDSVRRARHSCHAMGKAHFSLDMRSSFHEVIVKDFVNTYKAGETPNPCVRCNGHFRLEELVKAADVLGFALVATGHYVRSEVRGGVSLAVRGVDETKDQSYMLSAVDPAILARYWFPLGANHKREVRAEAAELGLVQAKIPGSQEICFLGGGNYRDFLARAGANGVAGKILLEDGRIVGEHDSMASFTPGQRKGIPVDHTRLPKQLASEPLFVKATRPATGDVIIAPRDGAMTRMVPLRGVRMHTDQLGALSLQTRYRHSGGPLTGTLSEDLTHFVCDEPVFAPAPGQVAAIYDGETVVGQAFISRA